MAEGGICYRLAKSSDASELARVHHICAADQRQSFFHRLGISFLAAYYRVLLAEQHSIVLCALDEGGMLMGFASGSLDAGEHARALRQNRLRLALASLPAMARRPGLLAGLISRQRLQSADADGQGGYIVLHGPREEYWAWLPQQRKAGGAIELHRKWLELVRLLGAQQVRLEVDRENPKVEQLHLKLGARVVKQLVTPDGKERVILEYPFHQESTQ